MSQNGLTDLQVNALIGGLNPQRVAKRKQSGQSLSYLEAWDVKRSLIRVFGFAGFSAELIDSRIVHQEQVPNSKNTGMNWKIAAQATVRLTIHQTGAVYTETAVAGSSQPDITESLDMALKSAESDALKRAAIYLGTQFGLSLYDNGSTADVVRLVFAPGQERNVPPAMLPRPRQEQGEQQAQGEPGEALNLGGLDADPAAKAEAEALVQRAFSAKAARDAERQTSDSSEPTDGPEGMTSGSDAAEARSAEEGAPVA